MQPTLRATTRAATLIINRADSAGRYELPRVAYLYVTQCGQRCPRVEADGWPALRLAATGADWASGT